MFELLFLLSFTLHNIEEGLWLPRWSKHAGKYHPEVSNREFHFALIAITAFGFLVTFLFLGFGSSSGIIRYCYFGFVLMMALNAIFPHFIATILLKRYAPGTLTGLMLIVPIGAFIIYQGVALGSRIHYIVLAGLIITIIIVPSLKILFKLGRKLIDEY